MNYNHAPAGNDLAFGNFNLIMSPKFVTWPVMLISLRAPLITNNPILFAVRADTWEISCYSPHSIAQPTRITGPILLTSTTRIVPTGAWHQLDCVSTLRVSPARFLIGRHNCTPGTIDHHNHILLAWMTGGGPVRCSCVFIWLKEWQRILVFILVALTP